MAASTPRIDNIETTRPTEGEGLSLVLSDGGDRGGSSSGETFIVNFDVEDITNNEGIEHVAQTATTASYLNVTETGVYSISWLARNPTGNTDRGISKNAKGASDPNGSGTDFTSSSFDKLVSVVGAENTLAMLGGESQSSNEGDMLTVVVKLNDGDRVRCHATEDLGTGNNNWIRVEQLLKF